MVGVSVRSVLAAESIKREEGGQPFVIGIVNPLVRMRNHRQLSDRARLRFHFLLMLDVGEPGEHELTFRMRGLTSLKGQRVKLGVDFRVAAKQIPFPIGPLAIPLVDDERGFKLQQEVDGRWRTLATWTFQFLDEE